MMGIENTVKNYTGKRKRVGRSEVYGYLRQGGDERNKIGPLLFVSRSNADQNMF